jgi:RNA-directed DNA polymerase
MQSSIANVTERTTEWQKVNWRKANSVVRNLRLRIFRATKQGNLKKVRSLQKLLMRNYSNTLVSVRRVTQTNKGKRSAGVDKLVVKTPKSRGLLVDILTKFIPWKPYPTKRVYIPKSNGAKRPLGIPSIIDRCLQAIVKNALEPFWEAKFEGISYGFRPGRSQHDAIGKIYLIACPHRAKKWVVDADIKGCFDNINHEHLMKAIGNFPSRKLIHQWLKAGHMEDGAFYDSEAGTPQGGIISPLLANISLHGMEKALGVKFNNRGESVGNRQIVRYADDFVVFCKTKEDAEKTVVILESWLQERGLNLSKEKTRITHLSEGFDFLGFNIRQYKVNNTETGWKLLIKPSTEALQRIRDKLRQTWLNCKGHSVKAVINKLNPIVRGQANYYRIGVSSKAFSGLDDFMFKRETRYANWMHPKKNNEWKKHRYWGKLNLDREDRWVFGDKRSGQYLFKFSWFDIQRHELVKGASSPDDPELKNYWGNRNRKKSDAYTPSIQKVAIKQNCICPVCGQSLFNDEEIHVHHIIPKKKGGNNKYSNLQVLHLYCHQQIHAQTSIEEEQPVW